MVYYPELDRYDPDYYHKIDDVFEGEQIPSSEPVSFKLLVLILFGFGLVMLGFITEGNDDDIPF